MSWLPVAAALSCCSCPPLVVVLGTRRASRDTASTPLEEVVPERAAKPGTARGASCGVAARVIAGRWRDWNLGVGPR